MDLTWSLTVAFPPFYLVLVLLGNEGDGDTALLHHHGPRVSETILDTGVQVSEPENVRHVICIGGRHVYHSTKSLKSSYTSRPFARRQARVHSRQFLNLNIFITSQIFLWIQQTNRELCRKYQDFMTQSDLIQLLDGDDDTDPVDNTEVRYETLLVHASVSGAAPPPDTAPEIRSSDTWTTPPSKLRVRPFSVNTSTARSYMLRNGDLNKKN